jgi:hypothetical protein
VFEYVDANGAGCTTATRRVRRISPPALFCSVPATPAGLPPTVAIMACVALAAPLASNRAAVPPFWVFTASKRKSGLKGNLGCCRKRVYRPPRCLSSPKLGTKSRAAEWYGA